MIGTPLSNRLHIGIFGRRNAGKSTLINALTGQDIAIVSPVPGTTTDPVYKAMEIHEIGPVVVIDTGGIDDDGEVGRQRVQKAFKVLNKTDIALLVADREQGFGGYEKNFLKEVGQRRIPALVIVNKIDVPGLNGAVMKELAERGIPYLEVSALRGTGIHSLRKRIIELAPEDFERKIILSDLVKASDWVLMVAPLDMEAPKGRLKIPQVQTIRDLLDHSCNVVVVKETEVENAFANLKTLPRLVVAESQVFGKVARILPEEIPVTTFSILYARYKGNLQTLVEGAAAVDRLRDADRILIAEACTHHPIGDDIGRVVIPGLLEKRFRGKGIRLQTDHAAGFDFPEDLKKYKLIVHCGGCMLNMREMTHRLGVAKKDAVAMTNYGILIAHLQGLLERAVRPFGISPLKKETEILTHV